jgi:hypothetical protein
MRQAAGASHREARPRSTVASSLAADRADTLPRRIPNRMRKESTITSALAGLEAALRLVDDVEPPAAPYQAVVAVPAAQRLQGVANLHRSTFIDNIAPSGGESSASAAI